MRYGYYMGFGNGYGFYGLDILIIILIIFVIFIFVILRNKKIENLFVIKLIDIFKEKYVLGIINVDEYIERKVIIEDIEDLNFYIIIFLKRYL